LRSVMLGSILAMVVPVYYLHFHGISGLIVFMFRM
jgi:hypothetical protein